MRAAKGHCDNMIPFLFLRLCLVGVMRAAKGHCDNDAGVLF
jgi:hypothetical protein